MTQEIEKSLADSSDQPQVKIDIWIIHSEKRILISDLPGGPPVAVCGYFSQEAALAAKERGYATVSEIGFSTDCHLQAADWTEANRLAEEKAAELGYGIGRESWEGDLAAALVDDDWSADEFAEEKWESSDDSGWWDDDAYREEDDPEIYSQ